MQIVTDQFQKEMKQHGNESFPCLISYEKLSGYEAGSFRWHWHPEIEITLVQKGSMCYKVNHDLFYLMEGDILFGNANVLHSGYQFQGQDCEYISITFDPKLIFGFHKSVICQKYVEPVIQNFGLSAIYFDYSQEWHFSVAEAVRELIYFDKEKIDFYEMNIVIELQKMWKLIFANYQAEDSISIHDKLAYERIKGIMGYLELHYMDKISLADIAEHVNLCSSECSRLFKKYMNVSLFRFLNEYRIERSLEYLFHTEDSITDIAARVGFSDSNYYSKVFSKIKGCSPCKYRKNA